MLTDFQIPFTDRQTLISIVHHTLNVSLYYLVKYLCSKNRQAQRVIEANCHVSKTVLKYLSGKIFFI